MSKLREWARDFSSTFDGGLVASMERTNAAVIEKERNTPEERAARKRLPQIVAGLLLQIGLPAKTDGSASAGLCHVELEENSRGFRLRITNDHAPAPYFQQAVNRLSGLKHFQEQATGHADRVRPKASEEPLAFALSPNGSCMATIDLGTASCVAAARQLEQIYRKLEIDNRESFDITNEWRQQR